MEKLWNAAISLTGIAGVGAFVLWALYKDWLHLPALFDLTKEQRFALFKIFLYLTFAFAIATLALSGYQSYIEGHKPGTTVDVQMPIDSSQKITNNNSTVQVFVSTPPGANASKPDPKDVIKSLPPEVRARIPPGAQLVAVPMPGQPGKWKYVFIEPSVRAASIGDQARTMQAVAPDREAPLQPLQLSSIPESRWHSLVDWCIKSADDVSMMYRYTCPSRSAYASVQACLTSSPQALEDLKLVAPALVNAYVAKLPRDPCLDVFSSPRAIRATLVCAQGDVRESCAETIQALSCRSVLVHIGEHPCSQCLKTANMEYTGQFTLSDDNPCYDSARLECRRIRSERAEIPTDATLAPAERDTALKQLRVKARKFGCPF